MSSARCSPAIRAARPRHRWCACTGACGTARTTSTRWRCSEGPGYGCSRTPACRRPGPPRESGRAARPDLLEVGELAAELEHCLGVELADPALGDSEHLADLGQCQTFEVVQRDHDLLPLRELVD